MTWSLRCRLTLGDVAATGMTALEQAMIDKLSDPGGQAVRDETAHNNGL